MMRCCVVSPIPGKAARLARAGWLGIALLGPALLASCGPLGSGTPATTWPGVVSGSDSGRAVSPGEQRGSDAAADPVEAMERRLVDAAARAIESVVALEYSPADGPPSTRRVAAGVVIDDEGHVLSMRIDSPPRGAGPILARDRSGRVLAAAWTATDAVTGLTLLKIQAGRVRPAVPAARETRPGLSVLVVGNPYGLGQSVSRGLVAGLNRRVDLSPRSLGGLIQVDVSLHPGDSGALLADLRGDWLGLIRGTALTPAENPGPSAPSPGPAGKTRATDHHLGFAIAASDALWVAEQLRRHRRVERAYLGVIADPTPPIAEGAPAVEGLAVRQVLPDTPADRAGLRPGDRLLALDDHPVHTPFDLTDRLDRTAAGTELVVEVDRPSGAGQPPARLRLPLHTTRHPPTDPPRPKQRPEPPGDAKARPSGSEPLGQKKKAPPADDATAIARGR